MTVGSAAAGVDRCRQTIASHEPHVRAWVHLQEHAVTDRRVRELDAAPDGPLTGRTVGLKDLIDTATMPTGYGSPIHRDHRPAADAAVVSLIERAGGCVLGKTVTTEFALMTPGPTVNPQRPGHTPGGSSSGSAAAVAAGMADVGIGTQTYGSMIRPGAYCGVWAFTPSFGTVSMAGIRPLAPSFDKIGWFTRSLDELETVHEALTGERRTADPVMPSVGILALADVDGLAPEVQAIEPLLHDRFGDRTEVLQVRLQSQLTEVIGLHHIVASWEIAQGLRSEYEEHPDLLSAPVRAFIESGRAVSQDQRAVAAAELATIGQEVLRVFDTVDVVITPATVGEAPRGLVYTGDPMFCTPWTALGCPAMAVPGLRGATGLPLGLQVVAAPGRDRRALDAARALRFENLSGPPVVR